MSRPVPVIGIAGGIGAGKSTVASLLGEFGAEVIDADGISQEVLESEEVCRILVTWWGPSVLGAEGRPDRSRIARIVFEDPEQRHRLEALLHPRIDAVRAARMNAARQRPEVRAIVIDAPLLFEKQLERLCDRVIFVEADEDVRRRRLAENRGWTPGELERREKLQFALDLKRARADHICSNNSDPQSLRQQVQRIFRQILDEWQDDAQPRRSAASGD